MDTYTLVFKSSIGKKFLMAVTGFVLFGFIIVHLLGNLQIFAPPEQINYYAYYLRSWGSGLWVARILLLLAAVVHVWMAVLLTVENKTARPVKYDLHEPVQATYAARTMRFSGFIVLAFLLFHLSHYTVFLVDPGYAELEYTLANGAVVHDVHTMMILGFSRPLVSFFYIVAVGLLSLHLRHGLSSVFQSVGARNSNWAPRLETTAITISVIYFALNAIIPIAVLAGWVTASQ